MADRVLVTGVSGFIGGHVALELLRQGCEVRGSVRELGKAERVRATLAQAGADVSRLDFVALDLLRDAGWDAALAGVRYLQHTASPFVTAMPADPMELVRPAVEGTRRAVTAALAAGVERLVVTSSVAAIVYGHAPARTAFTAADWTDLAGRGVSAYTESKTRAEREAWALVEAAGRREALATINPGVVFGPLLDDDPGTSVGLLARMFDGSLPAAARISFILADVRDVAAAHAAAMVAPAARGQRLPLGAGTRSLMEIAGVLRAAFPERAGKLPRFEVPDWLVRVASLFDRDIRGNLAELGLPKQIDASAVEALLGRKLIDADAATVAAAESLIAMGLAGAKKD